MIRRTAILAAITVAGCGSPDSIEYRGEQIKLSRPYFDYDEYKNDPNNIHPSEVARVQQLVRSAPPGLAFGEWFQVVRSATAVRFPGYGSGSLKSDWQSLRALTIEVPQADQERVFVFRAENGGWRRIDDFLMIPEAAEVKEVGKELVFLDRNGKRLLARPLTAGTQTSGR